MREKSEPHFTCLFIYTHFGCLSLELNRVLGVLLEPHMSQGGQGSAELPIVLKGLSGRKHQRKQSGIKTAYFTGHLDDLSKAVHMRGATRQ